MSIRNFTIDAIIEIFVRQDSSNGDSGRGDRISCEVFTYSIKHRFLSVQFTVTLMFISWLGPTIVLMHYKCS